MRIFMNKKSGTIYLLTFINSRTGVFVMENDKIKMKLTVETDLDQEEVIRKDFFEVGYL